MCELNIELGKFYRLRNGNKYRCYAVDGGGEHCVHGAVLSDGAWYSQWHLKSGKISDSCETNLDIIAEWEDEPIVNWDLFPEHIVCIAMNRDGTWFAHTTENIAIVISGWASLEKGTYHSYWRVINEDAPIFSGDWLDSKAVRPGHGEGSK